MKKAMSALFACVLVVAMALSSGFASAGKGNSGPSLKDVMPAEDDGGGSWTIMVYMAADNNLEQEAFKDLMELEKYGSDAVNVIVLIDTFEFIDGSTHWYVVDSTENHYDFATGDHTCDCEAVIGGCPDGDLNTADGATLTDFIVGAVQYAPADHYMLVLWDHGASWWGVCYDDSADLINERYDRLSINEIGDAIRAAMDELGEEYDLRLDIIGFDACLMSMIEVAYEMKDLADYMVASVTSIPFAGWAYDMFMDDLAGTPGMDALELCGHIVDGYVEYYGSLCAGSGMAIWNGVGLSAVDLSKMDELAGMLDDLAAELLSLWESGEINRGTVASAANANTPGIVPSGQVWATVDIGLFAAALAQGCDQVADLAVALEEFMQEAAPVVDWVSPASGGGSFSTTGLGIYLPVSYHQLDVRYAYTAEDALAADEPFLFGLDFAQEHMWDEFIFAFCTPLTL